MVTQEMIEALAKIQGVNPDVAEGTLTMWSQGQGELDADIVEKMGYRELFAPVREAYFAAHASPVPAYMEPEKIFSGDSTIVEVAHVETPAAE